MDYTSYVDNWAKPDDLDVLEIMADVIRRAGKPVYVLALPAGRCSLERLKEVCKSMPKASYVLPVYDTLDIVVGGDQKTAEEIGKIVSDCTGENVGCAEYGIDEEGMINFYRKLKAAIRAARKAIEPVHTIAGNE